jgi:hypothetical protein
MRRYIFIGRLTAKTTNFECLVEKFALDYRPKTMCYVQLGSQVHKKGKGHMFTPKFDT